VLATPETLQQEIETGLRQRGRNLTAHPVLDLLDRGELTRAQVQGLLTQMYVHVREVTRWIAASFAACPYPEIRDMIFENLLEEQIGYYSKTKAHADLLRDCALAAGVSADELDRARPLLETAALIDYCELTVTQRHWLTGLEGLGIALETQAPIFFGRIGHALIKSYGMDEEGAKFFLLHISVDEDHGDVNWRILQEHATSEALQQELKDAIFHTAERWWGLLDTWKHF
jgi:pyrroloquinoline quinone (PQQ) biosynthesis protein C